jgi:hypothetical protein
MFLLEPGGHPIEFLGIPARLRQFLNRQLSERFRKITSQ